MSALVDLLKNKAFVSAIATILFNVANRLGIGLDQGTVDLVCGSVVAVILGFAMGKRSERKAGSGGSDGRGET